MKRYFVTQCSARNKRFKAPSLERIPDNYFVRARLELPEEVRFVREHELYRFEKNKNRGEGLEIILSRLVGVLYGQLKADFPQAKIPLHE